MYLAAATSPVYALFAVSRVYNSNKKSVSGGVSGDSGSLLRGRSARAVPVSGVHWLHADEWCKGDPCCFLLCCRCLTLSYAGGCRIVQISFTSVWSRLTVCCLSICFYAAVAEKFRKFCMRATFQQIFRQIIQLRLYNVHTTAISAALSSNF